MLLFLFGAILLGLLFIEIDAIDGSSGEINISLHSCEVAVAVADTRWICMKVTDTGEGLSEAQKEKMFDPFYTSKPVGKGTGLDLSETFGIVSKAGGGIEVDSTPGSGTEISIYFPVHRTPDADKIV